MESVLPYYSLLFFLFINAISRGQTSEGIVVYYPFDSTIVDVTGNSSNIAPGNSTFDCGITGQPGTALYLNGLPNSYILIFGPAIKNTFKTADFTISFYFKSLDPFGTKAILSKKFECDADSALAIRYSPVSRTLSCELEENSGKVANVQQKLDPAPCWFHVVMVRSNNKTLLYVNGVYQQQASAVSRIDLESDEPLGIAYSPCLATTDKPFIGLIDELRIYNRALLEEEISDLYLEPDKIINRDTIVFLSGFVPISITNTCATTFTWNPSSGVSDPVAPEPVITPEIAGDLTYTVAMNDNACVAVDTIHIKVIDPADLDCNVLFLPKAFTPNGDGLNDQYGISNPYVMDELISFEIFDRWGNLVFSTTDPFLQWDGSFRGLPVNPGVLMYKVQYTCEGVKKSNFGSITLIR